MMGKIPCLQPTQRQSKFCENLKFRKGGVAHAVKLKYHMCSQFIITPSSFKTGNFQDASRFQINQPLFIFT